MISLSEKGKVSIEKSFIVNAHKEKPRIKNIYQTKILKYC